MKNLIIGSFCLALLSISCKKSTDAPPALTKENVAGNYKIIGAIIKTQGEPDQDIFAGAQACQKDDITHFNVDGTIFGTDDGTVCDPAGGWTGTWSLQGTNIYFDDVQMTVSKWDGSILEITYATEGGGIPWSRITTYKRQ